MASPTSYYNYATYTDMYVRSTVVVRPSTLNFLCPMTSGRGYVSYNLYRGMYTFGRGCSGSLGLSVPVTCTTERGSVERIRDDHDNTTFVTVSSCVLRRNNTICNTNCASRFHIMRGQTAAGRRHSRFGKDGCMRDSVNGYFQRIGRSLGENHVMLFSNAPYRASKLGSCVKGGLHRGLCLISVIYRNIPNPCV